MSRGSVRLAGVVALVALVGTLNGCGTVTVTTGTPMVGRSSVYTAHRFFWGLVGGSANTGTSGLSRVEVYQSGTDHALSWVTIGVYCPATVEAWALDLHGGGANVNVVASGVEAPSRPYSYSPPAARDATSASASGFCAKCGQRSSAEARFCRRCGAPLN